MKEVQTILGQRLQARFDLSHVEVINESFMHNVPDDAETHFKVVLVSEDFTDLNRVKRHQEVYALVKDLMPKPIHALAIHAYTQSEWQGISPDSPNCLGGKAKEVKS